MKKIRLGNLYFGINRYTIKIDANLLIIFYQAVFEKYLSFKNELNLTQIKEIEKKLNEFIKDYIDTVGMTHKKNEIVLFLIYLKIEHKVKENLKIN